nr:hypothetical protein [Tanacetum cinerariifolium]
MKFLELLEKRISRVRKHLKKANEKMDINKRKEKMVIKRDNMMSEVDIKNLTIEQYLMVTQGDQAHEAPSCGTNKVQGVSFVAEEEGDTSGTLPCQLHLGASVNIMPKLIFEHLKLANLKETSMVVEMADMTKKAPLGIVENIKVKINKPFLATIHAQIDVFKKEILLGIKEDRIKFDMDGGASHSKIHVEKIYMESSVRKEEYFNPLEIENGVFSYEPPACLLFEQHNQSCENKGIDTLDLVHELESSRKDCGMWPACNPDLSFCSGYDAIYGKRENGMLGK